jgi:transcriptional regulator with XRE-family HTH domain
MKRKKGLQLNPLKRWRAKRKLSLKELGAKAGIDPSSVSLIENNHRRPHLTTVAKLAEALEIEIDELSELIAEDTTTKESSKHKEAALDQLRTNEESINNNYTKMVVYLLEQGKGHLVDPLKTSHTLCGRLIPEPVNIGLFFEKTDCTKCYHIATKRGYNL